MLITYEIIIVLALLVIFIVVFTICCVAYTANAETMIVNHLVSRYKGANGDCSMIPYREEIYVPEHYGVYEKRLATALVDISANASCNEPGLPPGLDQMMKITNGDQNYGYIFWNRANGYVVFAFGGTYTKSEFQADLDYVQVAPTSLNGYKVGILCHRGFYGIYSSVRNQLWQWWQTNMEWAHILFITGISLGGALSTLCAFDFADVNIVHYSFGAPRSGNVEYANTFNERVPTSLRVNNTEDIVPQLPLAAMLPPKNTYIYQHTGINMPFTISYPEGLEQIHSYSYIKDLPDCPQCATCKDNTD